MSGDLPHPGRLALPGPLHPALLGRPSPMAGSSVASGTPSHVERSELLTNLEASHLQSFSSFPPSFGKIKVLSRLGLPAPVLGALAGSQERSSITKGVFMFSSPSTIVWVV